MSTADGNRVRVARMFGNRALGAGVGVGAGVTVGSTIVEGTGDFLGLGEGLFGRFGLRLILGGILIFISLQQDATSRGLPTAAVRLPAFFLFWAGVATVASQFFDVNFPELFGPAFMRNCTFCGSSEDTSKLRGFRNSERGVSATPKGR